MKVSWLVECMWGSVGWRSKGFSRIGVGVSWMSVKVNDMDVDVSGMGVEDSGMCTHVQVSGLGVGIVQ